MTELDPDWPMDRVLTDETRSRIMRGYRDLLAAPDSDYEAVEITEGLPLDVGALLLERFEDNSVHAEVLMTREEHPALVTDDVEDCSHHVDGDDLSTLGRLVRTTPTWSRTSWRSRR